MPRKQEPTATDILQYFETAPIEVAALMVTLVKAAVERRRRPASKPVASPKAASQAAPTRSATMPPGEAKPIVMPEPKAPPAPPSTPPRTRKTATTMAARPTDVPLPLPGQVPVVGG